MAEEFLLECRLDQPAVLSGRSADVYSLVTIKPNPVRLGALMESGQGSSLPAHLIVLVDVSGSMLTLIEPDSNTKVVGRSMVEWIMMSEVEATVPSRRAVAVNVVRHLVERMAPIDRMTLIGFDDQPHTLARALAKGPQLDDAVRELIDVGGGGTSLSKAFGEVRKILSRSGTGTASETETQRIVLLTDGEDSDPDLALREAKQLGEDFHLPICAFGTGDSRADFLLEVCRTTLGGSFDNIRNEREAEDCFQRFFTGQKNILATNVSLKLWLSPEIFVRELYRTKPEVLYVGDMQPDSGNSVDIPLEYMERGKIYELLFRSTVPARDAGRFRLAKATLTYDVPGLGVTGGRVEANIAVESTPDENRTLVRTGDVRRVITQAETQRQVLFLQGKRDLIERGQATAKDKDVVAKLLEALIKKFEEQGDQANLNMYRQMQSEFQTKGLITQEMMNRSLAASSKVEGAIALQEVDDF
ncbi:VWA domain-containing protein [Schlesneria sp.]|uniref:VWA domain-containing protein n=1 Tax=Schlesneria sp. TaxID=2762018 RepID=UPI002EE2DF8B